MNKYSHEERRDEANAANVKNWWIWVKGIPKYSDLFSQHFYKFKTVS